MNQQSMVHPSGMNVALAADVETEVNGMEIGPNVCTSEFASRTLLVAKNCFRFIILQTFFFQIGSH